MIKLLGKLASAARWVVETYKAVNERLQKTKFVLYIARYFVKGRHRTRGEAQYAVAGKALLVRSAASVTRRRNPVSSYLRAHRARRAAAVKEPAIVARGCAAVPPNDPVVDWVERLMVHNTYYDDIMHSHNTDWVAPLRTRILT